MECLSIIQGDTLDAIVTIEKPSELVLEKVRFVCASLELDEELSETESNEDDTEVGYNFSLTPEITQSLGVGNWNFDIIVELDSGEIYTVLQGLFEVKYRKNA